MGYRDMFVGLILLMLGITLGWLLHNIMYPPFLVQEIATNVALSNVYDKDRYNCVNFSLDLINALKQEGYNAHLVAGYLSREYCKFVEGTTRGIYLSKYRDYDCGGGHAWVEVVIPIESVTGKLINPKRIGGLDYE